MGVEKIGRNQLCPCGSGNKFKHCHGAINCQVNNIPVEIMPKMLKRKLIEIETAQKQRQKQQGFGKPIISAEFEGYRVIAVRNHNFMGKWKTFHDFLVHYIKVVLSETWGNKELKKEYSQRHPILQWYTDMCLHQRQTIKLKGVVHSSPMIGAALAYLWLAYNLYLIDHNEKLQSRLIKRLKDPAQFPGAYYETYVAAIFIKAGFELEFEDESDGSTTHCEFVAIHKETGNKYSVEAKFKNRTNVLGFKAETNKNTGILNLFCKALKKDAKYPRIIFIDVNLPNEKNNDIPTDIIKMLQHEEKNLIINGKSAPSAYVFITNQSYHYHLHNSKIYTMLFAGGFKIPNFKSGSCFPSLKEARKAREKHANMYRLLESFQEHTEIPSTFDGEIPEFAFGSITRRFKIGEYYEIFDESGKKIAGQMVDAIVSDTEKKVYGFYKLPDGKYIAQPSELTDKEFEIYCKYKDTFFGIYRKSAKQIKDPLELFDLLYNNFQNLSKEELIQNLNKHSNFETLKSKTQQELLELYCDNLVSIFYKNN